MCDAASEPRARNLCPLFLPCLNEWTQRQIWPGSGRPEQGSRWRRGWGDKGALGRLKSKGAGGGAPGSSAVDVRSRELAFPFQLRLGKAAGPFGYLFFFDVF